MKMGIQDNTKAGTTQMAAAFEQATNISQPQQQSAAPAFKKPLSLMSLTSFGGLSRNASSEVLLKAHNAILEESKKLLESPWSLTLLTVDNAKESHLLFSSIIVVVRQDAPYSKELVSFHTLMLEGSGDPLVSKMDSFQGVNFEVQRFTCDAYNDIYHAAVVDTVKRAFPKASLLPTDSTVVPRTFNFEDKNAVHSLILNAALAGTTAIGARDPEYAELDLSRIERDITFGVRLNFNEPEKADYVGLPVRAPIKIALTISQNGKMDNNKENAHERSRTLSEVSGYIDPIWAPMSQQYAYSPTPVTQKFAARFVMTQLESVTLTTIPAQLLALASAMVLREGTNYFPYFTPRPTNGRNIDLHDVAALNIEGNIENNPSGYGAVPDTKSSSFTNMDLGKILTALMQPGMHFSLRVSEAGADTWYNSVFRAAADGDQNAAGAILRAANTLTGGRFSSHYATNENPVIQNLERVHLGYYIGTDGAKHDIADVDYLAVMNVVGRQDPTVGAQWTDTFFRTNYPQHQRLSARRKMIEAVAKTDVVFTGAARLVTFTNKFIDAFGKALAEVGLDIRTTIPNINGDFFSQRAQASYLSQAQVVNGISGMFNQNYGQQSFSDPRGFVGRSW